MKGCLPPIQVGTFSEIESFKELPESRSSHSHTDSDSLQRNLNSGLPVSKVSYLLYYLVSSSAQTNKGTDKSMLSFLCQYFRKQMIQLILAWIRITLSKFLDPTDNYCEYQEMASLGLVLLRLMEYSGKGDDAF